MPNKTLDGKDLYFQSHVAGRNFVKLEKPVKTDVAYN